MAIKITGTTVIDNDRSLDNFRLSTVPISTNTTAVTGRFYVATASLTLTLPSPSVGDIVGFSNQSGERDCVIERNATNIKIMGIEEDMIIDALYVPLELQYSGATKGWVFV